MSEIPQSLSTQTVETGINNPELKQILSVMIPETINSFIAAINTDEFSNSTEESLGDKSIKNRDTVVEELHYLADFFSEYSKNPQNFSIRKIDDKNKGSYRINIGQGPSKLINQEGEDQVSLIFRIPTTTKSTRDRDIYHASLSGDSPDRVLNKIAKQEEYSIQINSSHIYMDEYNRMKIEPHAGVTFYFSKPDNSSVSGLSFIGTKPSYTPLESKPLKRSQFKGLKDFITSFKS